MPDPIGDIITKQLIEEADKTFISGSKVEHPSHYNQSSFEVMEVLDAWFPTNPLLWQVGKYIARAEYKGEKLEDLKKAAFYLQREIDKFKKSQPECNCTQTHLPSMWTCRVHGRKFRKTL